MEILSLHAILAPVPCLCRRHFINRLPTWFDQATAGISQYIAWPNLLVKFLLIRMIYLRKLQKYVFSKYTFSLCLALNIDKIILFVKFSH